VKRGTHYRALSYADIWVSPELLDEYRRVPIELEASGKITRVQMKALVAGIAAFVSEANVCSPEKRLMICRDPEDNMVLECCLAAGGGLLITGDGDLLEIPRRSSKIANSPATPVCERAGAQAPTSTYLTLSVFSKRMNLRRSLDKPPHRDSRARLKAVLTKSLVNRAAQGKKISVRSCEAPKTNPI
jgi:putative PIN family toxin of toxin-antitoxin system